MANVNKNNQNSNGGQQQRQKVTVAGVPPMVVDMFQQTHSSFPQPQTSFEGAKQVTGWTPQGNAVVNGGGAANGNAAAVAPVAQPMDFFGQGGGIQGKFDQMHSGGNVAQQPSVPSVPSGNGQVQQPYMGDMADKTPQPQTSFEGFEAPQFKPEVQPQQQGDLASLSAALSGQRAQQPQFQADASQRDGGFFGWLGGLIPKNRPGLREGETPDEYDARVTRNRQMYFTLADAIRHLGNIVNTSKGAPLQQFNDPSTMIEQGYQNRKAARQKQAALDADAAQKAAEMSLKERAQQIENSYKQYLMGLKNEAAGLNRDKFDWRKGKDDRDYKHKLDREAASDTFKEKKFQADQQQRAASNALRAESIAKRGSGSGRSGRSGSGSGAKYWFEGKDGKMRYQPNKTMWEQEYYREYGSLPQGETNTSTSTKSIDDKTGQEKTTTTRKKGASMTSQAAQQQNAAQRARKNQSARKGSKLKNTSALGL